MYGLPHSVYHNDIVLKYVEPLFKNVTFYYTAHMVVCLCFVLFLYSCFEKGSDKLNGLLPPPFKHYERKELRDKVFPNCFLGIRLTHHDGLAGGVQELGLMGIKSVWNGGTPSAIGWKNLQDIVKAVREEQKTVGEIDYKMAEKVKEFLTLDPNFYEMGTYTQLIPKE